MIVSTTVWTFQVKILYIFDIIVQNCKNSRLEQDTIIEIEFLCCVFFWKSTFIWTIRNLNEFNQKIN